MKPTLFDAVYSLVGGQMSCDGDVFESFDYKEGQTPPSKADAEAKLAEMISDWEALDYSRKREAEYPSIQECVHAILDDDLTALQKKRQAVKTKYPKS